MGFNIWRIIKDSFHASRRSQEVRKQVIGNIDLLTGQLENILKEEKAQLDEEEDSWFLNYRAKKEASKKKESPEDKCPPACGLNTNP